MFRWLSLALVATGSTAAAEEAARVQHDLDGSYQAEVSGFTDGTTSAGVAAIGGNLDYRASLLNEAGQSTYDIETGAGLALGRMVGTISATRAATRAHLRIGPAAVPASENRGNVSWFPFTFELDHDGELAALPRLSSRPDADRAVFDRGRLALATRMIRVEIGEIQGTEGERPPGQTRPARPVSSALDVITLYGDVEATAQGGTRVEGSVGGALMSVTNRHTRGERLDILALEETASRLPDSSTTSVATLWVLRMALTNPATGSQYTLGWGVAIGGPYDELATPTEDDPDPDLGIGGVGWWSEQSWGGLGAQFLRQPYVTMAGEPALDDRGWVEAWRAGKLQLSARGYVARTQRRQQDAWLSEWSTGLELGARRDVAGMIVDLAVEAGQTHYSQLDGGRPELGFAARGQLSLRRSGQRTWTR